MALDDQKPSVLRPILLGETGLALTYVYRALHGNYVRIEAVAFAATGMLAAAICVWGWQRWRGRRMNWVIELFAVLITCMGLMIGLGEISKVIWPN